MLDISITLVVIAHVVVSLLLILVILMQRPKQEGLGASFGSGVTDAAWGARTTDVLQKGTVYLGTLFFIFSLVLAILMGKRNAINGKDFASDGSSSQDAPVESNEGDTAPLGDDIPAPAPTPAPTPDPTPSEDTPSEGDESPAVDPETPAEPTEAPPEGVGRVLEEAGEALEGSADPVETSDATPTEE